MAENKKSFLLYCDLIHTISKMPNEKAGELFKHILDYVNDKNPETEDLIIQLTFEPIKQQMKRDLIKWEGEKKSKSESGVIGNLKRWNNDLYIKVMSKELELSEAVNIAQSRKVSHTDVLQSQPIANIAVNVNDNVNVTVNDNVIKSNDLAEKAKSNIEKLKEREKSFYNSLVPFTETYGKNMIREFFDYWSEPNRTNTKMLFEFKKTWDLKRRLLNWSKKDFNKLNDKIEDKTIITIKPL